MTTPALTRQDLTTLAALPPIKRMDALISREDAREAVQALAPFTLYHLIRDIGYSDALDLTLLASPQQIQAFVDFDAWRRDSFQEQGLLAWLRPLMEGLTLEEMKVHLTKLDPEPITLILQEHVVSFHYDEDGEVPPEIQNSQRNWETLDGVYGFLLPEEDEDLYRTLRQLLKLLYATDIQLAHRLLEGTLWELRTSLEETAYQMRTGRMQDAGFAPLEEALTLYAWRSPAKDKARLLKMSTQDTLHGIPSPHLEGFTLPDIYRQPLSEEQDSFFSQTLATLLDKAHRDQIALDLESFQFALVALNNRAMVADTIEPRDLEATRNLFTRVRGLLSLSLAYLSDQDLNLAATLLARCPLQDLARVGHNLTAQLSHQARALTRHQTIPLTVTENQPLGLLPEDDRLLIKGLLSARPLYTANGASYGKPFTDYSQIEQCATRLSLLLGRITAIFGMMKIQGADLAEAIYRENTWPAVELVNLDTILHTILANLALHNTDVLQAIAPKDLHTLHTLCKDTYTQLNNADTAAARRLALTQSPLYTAAHPILLQPLPPKEAGYKAMDVIVQKLTLTLTEELAPLTSSPDQPPTPEHLGGLLLLQHTLAHHDEDEGA